MSFAQEELVALMRRASKLESRLQNIEQAFSQLGELVARVAKLENMLIVTCANCGVEIPAGQGVGRSVPESEWTDKTKSRGIKITPLCMECMTSEIMKGEKGESR
jgi:hypothetical protein